MLSIPALLLALVLTWKVLKAVFLPQTQVQEDAEWLERERGFKGPENEQAAEEHRAEFMPERVLYAAAAWLLFAGLYRG